MEESWAAAIARRKTGGKEEKAGWESPQKDGFLQKLEKETGMFHVKHPGGVWIKKWKSGKEEGDSQRACLGMRMVRRMASSVSCRPHWA